VRNRDAVSDGRGRTGTVVGACRCGLHRPPCGPAGGGLPSAPPSAVIEHGDPQPTAHPSGLRRALAALLVVAGVGCAARPATAAGPAPARTLEEVVAATIASVESLRIAEAEVEKAALRSRRFFLYLTPDVRLQGSYLRIDAEDEGVNSGITPGTTYAWPSRSTSRCTPGAARPPPTADRRTRRPRCGCRPS